MHRGKDPPGGEGLNNQGNTTSALSARRVLLAAMPLLKWLHMARGGSYSWVVVNSKLVLKPIREIDKARVRQRIALYRQSRRRGGKGALKAGVPVVKKEDEMNPSVHQHGQD